MLGIFRRVAPSPAKSLQYLLFLPAIFRLLQDFADLCLSMICSASQSSGLRSNRRCLFDVCFTGRLVMTKATHSRFILFFDRVPNNSPRSSVTGDESIARACISSKAAFTETLLEMLFVGLMISLTVRALKFAPGDWLGFICSICLGADAGLRRRQASRFHWGERTELSVRSPSVLVHYATLTSRAFDLAFVVVGR